MAERRIPRNIAERTKFSPTPEVAGLHGILKIIGLVISDISTKCTQAVQSRCDTLNNRSWLREKGRSVAPQTTGSFGSWVPKLLFLCPLRPAPTATGRDAIFRVHNDKNERTQPPENPRPSCRYDACEADASKAKKHLIRVIPTEIWKIRLLLEYVWV